MIRNRPFITIILGIYLTACSAGAQPTPIDLPTAGPATATQAPSSTSEPTQTSAPEAHVIYDFQELACQAKWTNSGQTLQCPANLYESVSYYSSGFVSLANESYFEGNILIGDSALETHPAYDGSFLGIFGKYPPISIVSGDQFRATIGCRDGVESNDCNVKFSLEYYDSAGKYHDSQETGWKWIEIDDGQVHPIVVDLSRFAGETISLVLVVRDDGTPSANDNALWLHPQLWRK